MNDQDVESLTGHARGNEVSGHEVLGQIEEANLQSANSKELGPNRRAQDPQNLEDLAQKIFDQSVHDLEFEEESETTSSKPPSRSASSFVEVSHFSFYSPDIDRTSDRSTEADQEDVCEDQLSFETETEADSEVEAPTVQAAQAAPPTLEVPPPSSLLQNLCDEELIQEVESIPQRLSFKIGDVAELLKVKPFVLRYWETEFDVLKPKKAQNKQRIYTKKEVENAFLIRKLLHRDRFSIEGARNALKAAKQSLKAAMQQAAAAPAAVPQAPVVPAVPAPLPVVELAPVSDFVATAPAAPEVQIAEALLPADAPIVLEPTPVTAASEVAAPEPIPAPESINELQCESTPASEMIEQTGGEIPVQADEIQAAEEARYELEADAVTEAGLEAAEAETDAAAEAKAGPVEASAEDDVECTATPAPVLDSTAVESLEIEASTEDANIELEASAEIASEEFEPAPQEETLAPSIEPMVDAAALAAASHAAALADAKEMIKSRLSAIKQMTSELRVSLQRGPFSAL